MTRKLLKQLTARIAGGEQQDETEEQTKSVSEILYDDTRISKSDITQATGLTTNEFIVKVIAIYGGRLWQSQLVEILGWSEASVSRLLSELEADQTIERTRIGQKKIVFLPGNRPEANKSTLDGETDG